MRHCLAAATNTRTVYPRSRGEPAPSGHYAGLDDSRRDGRGRRRGFNALRIMEAEVLTAHRVIVLALAASLCACSAAIDVTRLVGVMREHRVEARERWESNQRLRRARFAGICDQPVDENTVTLCAAHPRGVPDYRWRERVKAQAEKE